MADALAVSAESCSASSSRVSMAAVAHCRSSPAAACACSSVRLEIRAQSLCGPTHSKPAEQTAQLLPNSEQLRAPARPSGVRP